MPQGAFLKASKQVEIMDKFMVKEKKERHLKICEKIQLITHKVVEVKRRQSHWMLWQ